MVPVPGDELPVRACVSIWVDAHDTAARTKRCWPRSASGAPGTSSPSRCTATTATTSTPSRATGPTAALARHRSRSPSSTSPPASTTRRSTGTGTATSRRCRSGCSRARATCATRWCARSRRARRVTGRSSRRRGRPSEHVTDLQTFFGAADHERARRAHPDHARQHQAALRPRDDAQLHVERVHPTRRSLKLRRTGVTEACLRCRSSRQFVWVRGRIRRLRTRAGARSWRGARRGGRGRGRGSPSRADRRPGRTTRAPGRRSRHRRRRACGPGSLPHSPVPGLPPPTP